MKKYGCFEINGVREKGITGNFDVAHFVGIHKFLFEDIYPFAGLFRSENIAKGYFQFAQWEYIDSELARLLTQLRNEKLDNLSQEDFAKRLAYYWSELNVLHPLEKVMAELLENL